jgi:hypothetical protein
MKLPTNRGWINESCDGPNDCLPSGVLVGLDLESEGFSLQSGHRRLERHGEGWEAVRNSVDSHQGWPLYLRQFTKLIAGEA